MLLSYKPVHLQAQQRLQEEGCVVDISHPLEGNLLLSYKTLHLEAQQRLQEESCVVDIKLFSGAVAEEVSA